MCGRRFRKWQSQVGSTGELEAMRNDHTRTPNKL
jgi:hypothetical protein